MWPEVQVWKASRGHCANCEVQPHARDTPDKLPGADSTFGALLQLGHRRHTAKAIPEFRHRSLSIFYCRLPIASHLSAARLILNQIGNRQLEIKNAPNGWPTTALAIRLS